MLSWQVRPEQDAVYFLALVTGDIESVRSVAADLDAIRTAEFTPIDDDTFYAYAEMPLRSADQQLMAAFETPGLVLVPPLVYTDTGRLHVTVLGEEATLSGLLGGFPEAVEVTVDRVSEHSRLGGSLAGRLTSRQFEALETAHDLGYYAVPREGSLAAVADALGCSESAASTLLREAESRLVASALGR